MTKHRALVGVGRALSILLALSGWTTVAHGDGSLTCPDGSAGSSLVVKDSIPDDGSVTRPLDWGVPTPEILNLPKFDSTIGTLKNVEIVARVRFDGNLCVDGTGGGCSPVTIAPRMQMMLDANPALPGVSSILMDEWVPIFRPGFLLGSSDGVADCVTPTGPESTGDCTPGEDHYLDQWDEQYVSRIISLTQPNEVGPWINPVGGPPETVQFDTRAFGLFDGGGGTNMSFLIQSKASVSLEVTYTYCSQSLGTSLHNPCVRSLGISFCDCTTSGPCGNNGAPDEGCANSTGKGAALFASGSASLNNANLVLRGSQLPAQKPGLFFQGNGAEGGGAGIPFGDGLRCVAGSIARLQIAVSDLAGEISSSIDLAAASGAVPGDRRYYQLWFREPPGTGCGSTFNSSNGLVLTWQP